MWAYNSIFYQIYPMGFCDASFENDGICHQPITNVIDWIPHIKKTGANAIYFSPVFESDSHGYNTRDYRLIDRRLGTNDDFKLVCEKLHENNIKVVLDGVFNHCGRGFYGFVDVRNKRENSPYAGWFNIDFNGNSPYDDGFYYEGWEGNYDLVKFNLKNPEVTNYLLDSVGYWIDEFDIDGIRLDVAYCLDRDYIRMLRNYVDSRKDDFYLLGEVVRGINKELMEPGMLDSLTNYESYTSLFSAFNSNNLFEIMHNLIRQFGPEEWAIRRGEHHMSFVDNHDVSRIATVLNDKEKLPLIYAFMFAMPGIPCVYYGSEWGEEGDKKNGDPTLRPYFDTYKENELTDYISKLACIRNTHNALSYGDFISLVINNKNCMFFRNYNNERILFAINIDREREVIHADFQGGRYRDLITGDTIDMGGGFEIDPMRAYILEEF